jgi:hypothetical protein
VFDVNLKVDVSGEGIFYFLEYGLKFKTPNGTIFMFRVEKNLHYTFKNAIGIQYGTTLFQKKKCFKTFKE